MEAEKQIPAELKGKLRILLAEDNLLNQKLLGFILKNWGLNVETAANGKQAIEKLEHEKFDLVLMDIEMPEMDGYEATQYIRNTLQLDIPIIAITAHEVEKEKLNSESVGMTDYIAKPIQGDELFQLLSNYLFPSLIEDGKEP